MKNYMGKNILSVQNDDAQDVAAIITAMTDGEQPFLSKTVEVALSDPGIGQVVLCVEEKNDWLDATLSSYMKDSRLCIVRLPMMPQGAVRNKALEHVQKSWVAYCDGDDVWCKGKTLIQRDFANKAGCDFVGADHYLTDEEGKIRAFALARYIPMPSSWMVRTETMRRYPFDESVECLGIEDGEWWVRTANDVQKARCPKMLLRYRVRSGSSSTSRPSKKRKTKVVNFAKVPILGFGILFFTYFAWLFTRQRRYVWLASWGQPPSLHEN
jgi:glycosyltransferase involved in cell wall biosynthesis